MGLHNLNTYKQMKRTESEKRSQTIKNLKNLDKIKNFERDTKKKYSDQYKVNYEYISCLDQVKKLIS